MMDLVPTLPTDKTGVTIRGANPIYENRELLNYCLNPALLCRQLDWYEGFLLENALMKEHLRAYGNYGPGGKIGGYSHSRLMKMEARIPVPIRGAILACDPDIETNQKKWDAFLNDHPELDMRIRN